MYSAWPLEILRGYTMQLGFDNRPKVTLKPILYEAAGEYVADATNDSWSFCTKCYARKTMKFRSDEHIAYVTVAESVRRGTITRYSIYVESFIHHIP